MDVEQVLHVNVGEGDMSYANRSLPQRSIILKTKPLIEEAVTTLFSKSNPERLNIADLGCSSGPNALSAVTLILDAVSEQGCFWPEIQVSLNDLLGNDFNTVFGAVPSSDKKVEMGLRHASHLQRLDHSTSGFSLAKACTLSTLLPASTGSLRYFLLEMLHTANPSHFGQAQMDKLFEKVEETSEKSVSSENSL